MKRGSPLALTVGQAIKANIVKGALGPGSPLPSERQLAEDFAVSRTVVRQALRRLANEGLIRVSDRCRPVVSESKPAARATREGVLDVGIWLWPDVEHLVSSSILRGIQSAAPPNRLRFMIGTITDHRPSWEDAIKREAEFLREVINDPHATGAIIWYLGGERNIEALHEARSRGLHLVFVDRLPPEGFEADFVGTANRTAARRAVSHLIELGHRRIACIPNMDAASSVTDRLIGYRQALREVNAEHIEVRYCPYPDEPEFRTFDRLVAELLEVGVTAVFAINDSIALGLSDALKRAGISVPDDMSVIGFDGLLRWLPGGGPLTTLNQDFYRVGELACELLLERIEGGEVQAFRHIYLDAPLTLHGSTAHRNSYPPVGGPDLSKGHNEEVRS